MNESHLRARPAFSRADRSHQSADFAQQSEQSAFESNPAQSKADVTSTTEVENASGARPVSFRKCTSEVRSGSNGGGQRAD